MKHVHDEDRGRAEGQADGRSHERLTNDPSALWDRLKGRRSVMLVDRFGEGLRARPMGMHLEPETGTIWFVTDRDSSKVEEIEARPDVCLTSADDGANTYVSVTGRAETVDDRAKVRDIWSPVLKAWFEGPEDPRILLLKVTPSEAQIWDGSPAPIAAVKMAFAGLTGAKPDLGDVEKVTL